MWERIMPAGLDSDHRGTRTAAWFLVLYGVLMTGPGLIHAFAPDGGIASIGGVDMSSDFARIRAFAAWAGATQIVHGLACIAVGLRYRALTPLFLALALIERLVLAWSGWIAHPGPTGHHPPAHYGHLVMLPLLALFLWLALRRGLVNAGSARP
jgi:hypothetical protein